MPTISVDVPALGVTEEVQNYWCYAATESILRKAFGKTDSSQTEIAHNCFLRIAKSNRVTYGDFGKMTTYAQRALAQVQKNTVQDVQASWAEVKGAIEQLVTFDELDLDSDGLRQLLQTAWGEFDRTLFTNYTATVGDVFQVMTHIDDGGLIAAANTVHWRVIYGYDYIPDDTSNDEASKYRYMVYDPHDGSSGPRRPNAFNQGLTDVVYITA